MKVVRNCALAVRLVFQYAPWNAVWMLLGFFVPGAFSGLQILLVQRIVDSGVYFVGAGQENAPLALKSMVGNGVLLVLLLFFWVMLQKLGVYENRVIETKLTKFMAPDILGKLERLEYRDFESKGIQEVLARVSQSPWENIRECFFRTVLAVQTVLSIFFVLGVYMSISVWIGIGLALITVPMVVMNFQATKRLHRVLWDTTDEGRRMKDLKGLLQNKNAMYEMKVFESQALIAEKWQEASGRVESEIRREGGKGIALESVGKLLNLLYCVFILATLAYSLYYGTVTLGQFVGAIGSIGALSSKVNASSWYLSDVVRLALGMDFYREFLALEERRAAGDVEELSHYDIAFENVSFTYPGTEREVLNHVTFRIKEGERVAFVGENGAGKSTIIKLLCGLYVPDKGRVLIGGVEVHRLSERLRRKLLSVVFQDFQRYELTLRENVALGKIEKLEDDKALLEALCLAGAEELAGSSGEKSAEREGGFTGRGLDSFLGHLEEGGRDLSKGQWQRVAIARAFLADAAFCVLDEPTASLDPVAESHMYENFARIFHKSGTIMISHRLASAKMADRIMVLDGGRIIQNGSHEELMGEEGLYRTMYLAQSSWYTETTVLGTEAERRN